MAKKRQSLSMVCRAAHFKRVVSILHFPFSAIFASQPSREATAVLGLRFNIRSSHFAMRLHILAYLCRLRGITGAAKVDVIAMRRGFISSGISRTRSTESKPFSSEAFATFT